MSVQWLADNVREMLSPPLHSPVECRTRLVANFCGTRLYDASTCWGRLWSVIWAIISLFDWNESCKLAALIKAASAVHVTWVEKKEEIKAHFLLFQGFLDRTIHPHQYEDQIDLTEYRASQAALVDWNHRIWKAFEEEGTGAVDEKIMKMQVIFSVILNPENNGYFFDDMQHVCNQAHLAYAMLHLQKQIKKPYPLRAFSTLLNRGELSHDENRAISTFILNVKNAFEHQNEHKKVTVSHLHQALQGIASAFDASLDALNALEWPIHQAFLEQGCSIFLEADPQHQLWAKKCAAQGGLILANHGTQIQLGPQLSSGKSLEEEKHLVFELDNESVVVLSALNPVLLRFEWIQTVRQNDWGLPLPNLIDMGDRYAIYERLSPDAPGELPWNSIKTRQYHARIDGIVLFVQWMVKNQFMPLDLNNAMVRFGQQGRVKFLKPVDKTAIDMPTVVGFIRSCTAGDETLYSQILQRVQIQVQSGI